MGPKKSEFRACLICSILLSLPEFVDGGCPNCEDVVDVSPGSAKNGRGAYSPCYSHFLQHCCRLVGGATLIRQMKGSGVRATECTSVMWDGMICVMEPQESWVARWQRIGKPTESRPRARAYWLAADKRVRGLYAVRVTGVPPQDVMDAIQSKGGVYRSRDAVED
jgi:transcription elongation factor SPT4